MAKYTIELKEIDNIDYSKTNYYDGLYYLKDTNDYHIHSSNCWYFLGNEDNFLRLFKELKEESNEGMVKESFALKMLAIREGKVNNLDL